MGKWRNRPSRRIFHRQRSPRFAPRFFDLGAPLPEFWQDGIPLWEKKFCTLIGSVPWQKIVDSKKFIYRHSNVLNWNDSAAEEAFQNAKKRYWAEINNHPCESSLPYPDTYVDQIDWNPYINPELIKELDQAYFAPPDEAEMSAIKNKRPKLSVNGENPWECNDTNPTRALEDKIQGRSQWDNRVDNYGNVGNADNPWECSITRGNGGLADNAWEGGAVKLSGWNQAGDHNNQSRDWDSGNNPWENGCLGNVSPKDKGWGRVGDSSWNQQQSNNLVNIDNLWECKSSQHNGAPIGRGWKNWGTNEWGWKQHENADASSDLQFRKSYGGSSSWKQSFRKRENSLQYTSGYNSSQFQRDDHQTGHYWGRGNTKRRVSFAP